MREGLKATTKLRARFSHSLGYCANFAVILSEKNDDPISFTKFVCTKHDADIAIET
jgi:hypothetical protein